jgi:hypothetical protein
MYGFDTQYVKYIILPFGLVGKCILRKGEPAPDDVVKGITALVPPAINIGVIPGDAGPDTMYPSLIGALLLFWSNVESVIVCLKVIAVGFVFGVNVIGVGILYFLNYFCL